MEKKRISQILVTGENMIDEMTETTKISKNKCPKCGSQVEETRNAVVFIEACTKCDWRNTGMFL